MPDRESREEEVSAMPKDCENCGRLPSEHFCAQGLNFEHYTQPNEAHCPRKEEVPAEPKDCENCGRLPSEHFCAQGLNFEYYTQPKEVMPSGSRQEQSVPSQDLRPNSDVPGAASGENTQPKEGAMQVQPSIWKWPPRGYAHPCEHGAHPQDCDKCDETQRSRREMHCPDDGAGVTHYEAADCKEAGCVPLETAMPGKPLPEPVETTVQRIADKLIHRAEYNEKAFGVNAALGPELRRLAKEILDEAAQAPLPQAQEVPHPIIEALCREWDMGPDDDACVYTLIAKAFHAGAAQEKWKSSVLREAATPRKSDYCRDCREPVTGSVHVEMVTGQKICFGCFKRMAEPQKIDGPAQEALADSSALTKEK